MAILKDGNNTYEVRIKRCNDGTYFDEYEDTRVRRETSKILCNRYIVGEEGVEYVIEFKLHNGFDFGDYPSVQARLYVGGHTEAICFESISKPNKIDNTDDGDNALVGDLNGETIHAPGYIIKGSKLTFRGLSIDENLSKETNIMGVEVKNVGYFKVEVSKTKWGKILRKVRPRKVRAAGSILDSVLVESKQQSTWTASMVDADSFKKDGLEFGMDIIGGIQMPETPINATITTDGEVIFHFHFRSTDFLESQKYAKYPAASYSFAWENLFEYDRRTALAELQDINKKHVHRAREAKSGDTLPMPDVNDDDYLPDWRVYGKLYAKERKKAFDALKMANAAWENGEDPTNPPIKNISDTIIIEDSDEEDKKPVIKCERTDNHITMAAFEIVTPPKVEVKKEIVHDYVDIDAPPAKRPKVEYQDKELKSFSNTSDDEQLERYEKKVKQLAEDIEIEERLAKMKREQRELEGKIEAAKEKKKGGKK